jgi:hypothetical protein
MYYLAVMKPMLLAKKEPVKVHALMEVMICSLMLGILLLNVPLKLHAVNKHKMFACVKEFHHHFVLMVLPTSTPMLKLNRPQLVHVLTISFIPL